MTTQSLLLVRANILPMTGLRETGDALLLRNGVIERIGDSALLEKETDPGTRRIDLGGMAVIPGFNDNHIHAIIMGDRMSALYFKGMDERGIIEALRERFSDAPHGTTLYGFGWDYPYAPHPHRDLLDAAFPDNPVYLPQFSGHGAWANSSMLKKMGIRLKRGVWQAPGVGEVVTDAAGTPTGILREPAGNPFVRSILYRRWMDPSVIRTALEAALPVLASEGITTVQDNTWFPEAIPVLRHLKSEGKLTCRFSCWRYGMMPLQAYRMALKRHDALWFHRGPWKFITDGAFSSHSGWLFSPYADEPETSGAGMPPEKIAGLLKPLAARGIQAALHAIGDRAVASVCDAAEIVAEKYPRFPELRFRIEHAQIVRREDLPRMKRLGLLAAVQPAALVSPEKDIRLLGKARAETAYPYRSFLDAGIPLSFGSDYPGEEIYSPMEGIRLAVNREGPERLSAAQAFEAYTAGSAYAEEREREKGTITVGKAADLAVLSLDPLSPEAGNLGSVRVLMTITGGRIVYGTDRFAGYVETAGNTR